MNQIDLLRDLLQELEHVPDHKVHEIITGEYGHLVAVESVGLGIASWALHRPVPLQELPIPGACESARELSQSLLSEDPMEATIGLACLNSMLPPPPMEELLDIKAQDLIRRYGRGQKVAVIGHFPFVERIRDEFDSFWVLEKNPGAGDMHAEEAPQILPAADVVAISATTLANGTLAEILTLCSASAIKIMLGPSTPLSPSLFRYGIHILAGSIAENRNLVKQGILAGLPFKQLKGIRYVVWKIRTID
jgi:uncharacterized protein (DUF4213/DUF364 family)